MTPMDVFTLYYHRPDAPIDQWDICGFFSTREKAQEGLQTLMGQEAGLLTDDFVIEQDAMDVVKPS